MSNVILLPYSPLWPRAFESVSTQLHAAFATPCLRVEHIGSTAVPGLAAKPVIDVLLGAPSLVEIENKIEALNRAGYDYISKYEAELPMRRYFVKASVDGLRVHVHGVEIDSPIWRAHLSFRDALRADAILRDAYQALKLKLATQFAHDKAAYTEAKAPFIQGVLRRFV